MDVMTPAAQPRSTVSERRTGLVAGRYLDVRNLCFLTYKKSDGSPIRSYEETIEGRQECIEAVLQYELSHGMIIPDYERPPAPRVVIAGLQTENAKLHRKILDQEQQLAELRRSSQKTSEASRPPGPKKWEVTHGNGRKGSSFRWIVTKFPTRKEASVYLTKIKKTYKDAFMDKIST